MIPKFRAWLKNDKEMIDVRVIDWNNMIVDSFSPYIEIPLEKVILMQSTGLKDKNGKEIFEGDILAVETDDEVINVKVFWDKKHALYMFESKKFNEEELLAELAEDNAYPFEVIGNIHENQDILEVTDD